MRITHFLQLEILITEHHSLYVDLYGNLKPRFHLILHYIKLILKNGPLNKVSAMRGESKHRTWRSIAQNSPCKINILSTVAARFQLSQMSLIYLEYKDEYITFGHRERDDSYINLQSPRSVRYILSYVKINDFTYKANTTIVANISNELPEFGKITRVYLLDDEILFEYIPLKCLGLNKHYNAYDVYAASSIRKFLAYKRMSCRTPCILHEINDTDLIVITRHIF